MIRSMTGYGEAQRDTPAGRVRIEIKTVNHRFFNASIKTPPGFDRFERVIGEALKRHLARGHVHAHLSIDRSSTGDAAGPVVDIDRAKGYLRALEAVKDELVITGEPDLRMLAGFGDIFRAPDVDRAEGVEAEMLVAIAEEAALECRAMREDEGRRTEIDLRERLDVIELELAAVAARAPERLVEHRDRLRESVRQLAEQVDVDEDRLAREVAYLAERWDINEEIVRFRSHIDLFREALSADGGEPVGKRLGFLVQEMHREANTVASKANDSELAQSAVAIKEQVERLREQVENVE